MHHAFRLTDSESNRTLTGTLEIHTVELGRYNLKRGDLANASILDCWLFWLLHAHEYESTELLGLFPQQQIQLATQTNVRIAEITEDKKMYDAREKAIRDQQWALNASFRDGEAKGEARGEAKGKIEGEIKLIQTLQEILNEPITAKSELESKKLEELQSMAASLRGQFTKR